jgi:hypothetical protein
MQESDFLKACDWLYDQRWELTSDGNRGYYLNRNIDRIEMAYCTSKEDVIKFAENASIAEIFTERNAKYLSEKNQKI